MAKPKKTAVATAKKASQGLLGYMSGLATKSRTNEALRKSGVGVDGPKAYHRNSE